MKGRGGAEVGRGGGVCGGQGSGGVEGGTGGGAGVLGAEVAPSPSFFPFKPLPGKDITRAVKKPAISQMMPNNEKPLEACFETLTRGLINPISGHI